MALSHFTRFSLALLLMTSGASAQSALKGHDTYQPLDITADRLEVKQAAGRAIFKGGVRVAQGGLTLTSEALTVFYKNESGGGDPSIERLDASGSVKLVSSSESVIGDWGIYDVERRLLTVGGKVTLTRGDNILSGNRLELDLVSGLAKLDGEEASNGRVRGRFSIPTDTPDKEAKDPQ